MDFALESLGNAQSRALFTNATYLCDSLIRIDGVTFYGSPYTPKVTNARIQRIPRGGNRERFSFTSALVLFCCPSVRRFERLSKQALVSPATTQFFGVFQLYSDQDAKEMVEKIPNEVDVLITHGPPHGILDSPSTGNNVGCPYLRQRVKCFADIHNRGKKKRNLCLLPSAFSHLP